MKKYSLIAIPFLILACVFANASSPKSLPYSSEFHFGKFYESEIRVISKTTSTVGGSDSKVKIIFKMRTQIDKAKTQGNYLVSFYIDQMSMNIDMPINLGAKTLKNVISVDANKYLSKYLVTGEYDQSKQVKNIQGVNEIRVAIMENEKDPKSQQILLKMTEETQLKSILEESTKNSLKPQLAYQVGQSREEVVKGENGLESKVKTTFIGWDKDNPNIAKLKLEQPETKSVMSLPGKSDKSSDTKNKLVVVRGEGSITDNKKTNETIYELSNIVNSEGITATSEIYIRSKLL